MSSGKNNNHLKCNNQNSSIKESTTKTKGTSPPRLEKPLIVDPKDIYCET